MDLINKYINPQWVYINLVLCFRHFALTYFHVAKNAVSRKAKVAPQDVGHYTFASNIFCSDSSVMVFETYEKFRNRDDLLTQERFDKKLSGSNGWLFQTKHFKNKIHFIWTLPKGRSNTVEKINVQIECKSKSQMCWCQSTNWEW